MKILNLPLNVHEAFPTIDLARAIVWVDKALEKEIYHIAAMDQSHGLYGTQVRAGNEIAFVGWFGCSPANSGPIRPLIP
jgi:hypothetical protein